MAEGWSSEDVRTFVCFEARGMNSAVANEAGDRFGVSLENFLQSSQQGWEEDLGRSGQGGDDLDMAIRAL